MTEEAREAYEKLAEAVRASGLIPPTSRGVALLSGGPDSGCLAVGLVGAIGAAAVVGLHMNYGLRPDSGEDEAACRSLCELLEIELVVGRPELPAGNLQADARAARYEAAERLRLERGADWVATGHTRTDLAETVLYRLAVSPGRRALLGLAPRHGRVVRPLLASPPAGGGAARPPRAQSFGRGEHRRHLVGAGRGGGGPRGACGGGDRRRARGPAGIGSRRGPSGAGAAGPAGAGGTGGGPPRPPAARSGRGDRAPGAEPRGR